MCAGHVINGALYIAGIAYSQWGATAQQALVTGLASDVVPDSNNVFVTAVADASLAASWASIAPGAMPVGARGVLLAYMIDGARVILNPHVASWRVAVRSRQRRTTVVVVLQAVERMQTR